MLKKCFSRLGETVGGQEKSRRVTGHRLLPGLEDSPADGGVLALPDFPRDFAHPIL